MSNLNLCDRNEDEHRNRTAVEQAKRSFQLTGWLVVVTATFLVAFYLARRHPEWSPGLRVALALTPILPGLLYLRKGLQLLRGLDELQRRIQLEGWLFAALGTVVISTIINVLNANGVSGIWPPHGLEVGGTYMIMSCLWGLGVMIANLRYLR
jgi:hypothetical protein